MGHQADEAERDDPRDLHRARSVQGRRFQDGMRRSSLLYRRDLPLAGLHREAPMPKSRRPTRHQRRPGRGTARAGRTHRWQSDTPPRRPPSVPAFRTRRRTDQGPPRAPRRLIANAVQPKNNWAFDRIRPCSHAVDARVQALAHIVDRNSAPLRAEHQILPFPFLLPRPAPREPARSRSTPCRSCRSTSRRSSTRMIRIEMLGATVAFTRATRLDAMARARTSHRTASHLAGCPVRPRCVARLSSRSRLIAPLHDVAAGTRELDSRMAHEPRARGRRLAEQDT